MKLKSLLTVLSSGLIFSAMAQNKPLMQTQTGGAGVNLDTSKAKKPAGITDKVKSSKKIDGLFTLYQDTATGSVQLYVKKNQLGKEFIYQSFSISGPTQFFLNQSMHRATFVFKVQKAFDKLEFVKSILHFIMTKAIR